MWIYSRQIYDELTRNHTTEESGLEDAKTIAEVLLKMNDKGLEEWEVITVASNPNQRNGCIQWIIWYKKWLPGDES